MASPERRPMRRILIAGTIGVAGVTGYGIRAATEHPRSPAKAAQTQPALTEGRASDAPSKAEVEVQKIGIDNIVGPAADHFGIAILDAYPDFEKRANDPYDKNKLNIISAGKTINFDGRNDLIRIVAVDTRLPALRSVWTTTYEIEAQVSSKDPSKVEFFEIKKYYGLIDFDPTTGQPNIGSNGDFVQEKIQIKRSKLQLGLDGHWAIFNQNRFADSEIDSELSDIESIDKELELANTRLKEIGILG